MYDKQQLWLISHVAKSGKSTDLKKKKHFKNVKAEFGRKLHRGSSLRFYLLLFILFYYFLFVLDIFSDTHVRIGIQIASPLVNMLYWPSVDSSSARLFGTIMFTTGLTIAWAWELGEADGVSGTVTCVLSSNLFSERISSEMGFFNNHLFF